MSCRNVLMVRRRLLRDTSNPFMIGDETFRLEYRMYPWMAIELFNGIAHALPNHYAGVPADLQFLSVVGFLASGSYQKSCANDQEHAMSQPTFSKYIHLVIPAVNSLRRRFIRFPRSREERQAVQIGFQECLGFEGVYGAIDCTSIKIFTPSEDEAAYVDRENNHSLNMQIICDTNYRILAIRICNGRTHDQFIWLHSKIRDRLYRLLAENPGERFCFIADEGYTESRVLLIAVRNAINNSPEGEYSEAIRGTRCMVEQTIGMLKGT
ncbi:hypothetical protein QAD02_011710 [Eretmocerus hayati]|uniref:Uncharacterized protein n=1 Tax=Eretmocerus hayati TaxID=131215 RepID=A0ACC2NXB6_9HYME|nr:hypothetical protein QAD02_011710 [Eretmocerus hayati]